MINVGDLLAILRLQDEMSPVLTQAALNLQKTEKAAFSTNYQLTLLGRGMQEVGVLATAAFTIPIVAATKASFDLGSSFESTTAKLVSLAGVSSIELEGVRKHILDLGPAVGVGPQELALAMTKVSSTTRDTKVALEILDIAAKGSAVGMGQAVDVAGALTAVVNSYGKENITAARAGDILTKAIQDGGAEAKELAPLLANVVPFAAKLGVSFEEVAANIATVTKLGVPTSEAVTQLSAVFASLTRESDRGSKALESVGLSYTGLRQELREKGLLETLEHLKRSFADNEKGLFDVFGRLEGFKNLLATTGAQTEVYAEILDHMKDKTAALDGAFKEIAKTQTQQWNEFKSSVSGVLIELNAALIPAFTQLLGVLRDDILPAVKWVVTEFKNLPEPIKDVAIAIAGILVVSGPLLVFIGQLLSAFGNISRGFIAIKALGMTSELIATTGALKGMSTATELAGFSIKAFSLSLAGLLLNPVTVSLLAIAAAGTIVWQTYKLMSENIEREAASQRQATTDLENMARISRVAGIEFKTMDEAVKWANEHLPEMQKHSQITALSIKLLADSAKDAHPHIKTLTEKVAELTDEQKETIGILKEAGYSTRQIAQEMKSYGENTNVTTEVLGVYLRSTRSAMVEAAKLAVIHKELIETGEGWRGTLAKINPELVTTVENYLKAGVAPAKLAAYFDLFPSQLTAIQKGLTANTAAQKLAEDQTNALAKAYLDYEQVMAASNADQFQTKLDQIDIAAERDIQAAIKAHNYKIELGDIIYARAAEQKAQLIKADLEADVTSKAHYEKVAQDAEIAYNRAMQSSENYTFSALDNLRELAETARYTANSWSAAFGVAFDTITKKSEEGAQATKNIWSSASLAIQKMLVVVGQTPNEAALAAISAAQKPTTNISPFAPTYQIPVFGARAEGGPVSAGKTYLVGERGPEPFTPSQNGYITPNGTGNSVTVEVNMSGVLLSNSQGAREELRRFVNDAVIESVKRSRKVSVV